ncbi:putative N6-adenine-specific DNA methylase [Mariniphaga anaerophila]|uniref:Putative N6-adenine-specific DNA methylase n=1 Tax=Mariniphaga anaerophila TaxID=1484053 RepID=A0A1M5EUY8_9BACT|nr:THUMP domain-containing protein [Mariniphaga anaerophila]SHF82946.1 putative N6-adenine-specific DNA methylase [Mariniphaga anaerophila]
MKNFRLTAKTFSGLESVLAKEIESIGGENIKEGRRAVSFEGDLKTIYKSNYCLRTAIRVLKEIAVFQFNDIDQFYLRCKEVSWLKYFSVNQSFVINSTVSHSKEFRNSMFASLKVKDAIADHFRLKTGSRPNVDTHTPEIFIHAHINRNTCILSLDSSGESLHKRGYRSIQGKAPLSEVLAAGMILLSGWDGKTDFIDPMCGSGTLPIEAAMIAQNVAPGRFRKEFAFENWPGYDQELFESVKAEQQTKPFTKKIYASDISKECVLTTQTNARRARVFSAIDFQTSDMKDLQLTSNNATIIINPPYGERIIEENMDALYAMIGERLKHQFAGNTAWILTSSREYLKNVGLKPSKKLALFNGSLECSYSKYQLFQGKWAQS